MPRNSKITVGSLADKLWDIRESIREKNDELKELEKEKETLKMQLMSAMDEQGLDQVRGQHATISITSATVANIDDYDAFWAYVRRHNLPELLQRRLSVTAYRELLEERKGKPIPGTTPFEKRDLSVRTIK